MPFYFIISLLRGIHSYSKHNLNIAHNIYKIQYIYYWQSSLKIQCSSCLYYFFWEELHRMKLIQILTDIICENSLDPHVLDRAQNRKGAFTHNYGNLLYWTLIKLLLKIPRQWLLHHWMISLSNCAKYQGLPSLIR